MSSDLASQRHFVTFGLINIYVKATRLDSSEIPLMLYEAILKLFNIKHHKGLKQQHRF